MRQVPKISIITPSFNQSTFIEEAIVSVIRQGYPDLEHFVIDGGSTDGSVDTIRRYEKQLAYWVTEKDRGQSHAINKALEKASGDIIGWLNSDDTYLPGALETMATYFEMYPTVCAIYGDGLITTEDGRPLRLKHEIPFIYRRLWRHDFIVQPAFFFRREILPSIGKLREDLYYAMDWEFFLRIAAHCRIRHIPAAIATYRLQRGAKSMAHGSLRHKKEVSMIRKEALARATKSKWTLIVDYFWLPGSLFLKAVLVIRDNPIRYLRYILI